MQDIENILNFTHEELAEYTGEPAGTLGISMMEFLQQLHFCLGTSGTGEECDKCVEKYGANCVIDRRSMTLSVLMEMAELMRKNNDNKEVDKNHEKQQY